MSNIAEKPAAVSDRTPPDRQIAGWRRTALLEIAAFMAVALWIDWQFFDGNRYFNVQPHPFWILVLLIAAQYGTGEALVAALVATVGLLAWNLPPRTMDQDLYDYLFELARNPILWLITVIFIGEIGSRHRSRIHELGVALEAMDQRMQAVDDAYRRVAAAKSQLEIRVAGQMRTVVALYNAAKAIDQMQPEQVILGVDKIVQAILSPKKHSLFLLNGQELVVRVTDGWVAGDRYAKSFPARSLLFQRVIGEQRMICAATPEDAGLLGDEGVLAGPLIAPATGEVFGMLKIEDIGFLDFNLSTLENFRVTCEWIATAYAQAIQHQRTDTNRAFGESHNVFSAGFRQRQIDIITHLARRIGFDVCSLTVRVTGAENLPEERRAHVSAAVGHAVQNALRDTDLAFEQARSGWEFEVLLPATPAENAAIAGHKLQRRLDELLHAESTLLRASIRVGTLYSHGKSHDGTK